MEGPAVQKPQLQIIVLNGTLDNNDEKFDSFVVVETLQNKQKTGVSAKHIWKHVSIKVVKYTYQPL